MRNMAHVKIFVLLAALCVVNSSKLIYRKYEKQHPKRNYIQVVEIFETRQYPPLYTKTERELNDFLARDSYKTDMNCTKLNETDVDETTVQATPWPATKPVTLPNIPTTAYRRRVTTPPTPEGPTTIRIPNLNELFTVARTKPPIRKNTKENFNPNYEDLDWPKPTVQVTKHSPSTVPPTIVIQETDDYPSGKHTTLDDVDRPASTTTPASTTGGDEEIIYPDSDIEDDIENVIGEKSDNEFDDDYKENDIIPDDEIEPKRDLTEYYEQEDSDEPDGDDENYDDLGKRRRRRERSKRISPRTEFQKKSNQL